jgi:hypothetical protein
MTALERIERLGASEGDVMKRATVVMLSLLLSAALSLAASWTGWVSDEKCGKSGADHASCAKSCIRNGLKPVLAMEDGKVFQLSNPDKLKSHAGEKVTVTGTEKDGTITVTDVAVAQ